MKDQSVYRRARMISVLLLLVLLFTACAVRVEKQGPTTKKLDTGEATRVPTTAAKENKKLANPPTINSNADLPIESFSTDGLSEPRIDDVLNQIGNFGKGGGSYECVKSGSKPFFLEPASDRYLMEEMVIATCGWKKDEPVSITITDPAGVVTEKHQIASKMDNELSGSVVFGHQVLINGLPGRYTFHFTGSSGEIEGSASFLTPSGPKMYTLSADEMQQISGKLVTNPYLMLDQFSPNESVRLLFFVSKPKDLVYALAGTHTYQVDAHGRLFVEEAFTLEKYQAFFFVSEGQQSGEFHQLVHSFGGELFQMIDNINYTCPGAKPTRLDTASSIRIARVDGTKTRVRKAPGFDSAVLTNVAEGTEFLKVDGPKCINGTNWYEVYLAKNKTGWIAEVYEGKYILEPAP